MSAPQEGPTADERTVGRERDVRHPVARFFIDDHRRLEALLLRAIGPHTGAVAAPPADEASAAAPEVGLADPAAYDDFREGLLRHIGMEERVLFPALRERHGAAGDELFARLRRDHGAIVSLLAAQPRTEVVRAVRTVLDVHNAVEEGPNGAYALCEDIPPVDAAPLLARLRATPPVPVRPFSDAPIALTAARRSLALAGYDATAMLGPEGP